MAATSPTSSAHERRACEHTVLSAARSYVAVRCGANEALFARQTLLAAFLPRDALEALNLELEKPSDALANFKHNMKFQPTKGIQAHKQLSLDKIRLLEYPKHEGRWP